MVRAKVWRHGEDCANRTPLFRDIIENVMVNAIKMGWKYDAFNESTSLYTSYNIALLQTSRKGFQTYRFVT
jgi:hypothetical protein